MLAVHRPVGEHGLQGSQTFGSPGHVKQSGDSPRVLISYFAKMPEKQLLLPTSHIIL